MRPGRPNPISGGEGMVLTGHRGLVALPSRSVRRRFFSSQSSAVTGIGWPESSPSSITVSMRSSTLRF
jgi:hypothetical protein